MRHATAACSPASISARGHSRMRLLRVICCSDRARPRSFEPASGFVSKTDVYETAERLNSKVNSNTAVIRLAQICLRNGDPLSARLAFEAALRINPQLTQVRIAVEELRRAFPTVLH